MEAAEAAHEQRRAAIAAQTALEDAADAAAATARASAAAPREQPAAGAVTEPPPWGELDRVVMALEALNRGTVPTSLASQGDTGGAGARCQTAAAAAALDLAPAYETRSTPLADPSAAATASDTAEERLSSSAAPPPSSSAAAALDNTFFTLE